MITYSILKRVIHGLLPLIGDAAISGLENVPSSGPFLLLSNHQSVLDPFIIQALCPRTLHTMAKSTQFAAPIIGPIMPHVLVFPVRRFQTDPQSVRFVLKRLRQGQGVAIYIEGERSWDGRLQSPRRGTVRLALKAGVPIVPCTIEGTYDLWPRWDRAIQRGPIQVTYGELIRLPQVDSRVERDDMVDDAAERIMSAIADPLRTVPARRAEAERRGTRDRGLKDRPS